MKQRLITSILIIAGVIPLFFFKSYFLAIITFVAITAAIELNDLFLDKKNPLLILTSFALIAVLGFNFLIEIDKLLVLAIFLIAFAIIDIVYRNIKINDLALVFFVSTLLGMALSSIIYMYELNVLIVLFVIIANYTSDIGAYLVGSRFGKNKLAPTISPNKTVEGSIGGIVFSSICSITFGYFLLLDYFPVERLVLLALVIPTISQFGDLFFSSIKRLYNKKDFGSLFPGHGGVFDRIDSLIFSLLWMMIFISLGYLGVIV